MANRLVLDRRLVAPLRGTLAVLALIASASCGEVTIEDIDGVADLDTLADVGSDTASDISVDSVGGECITDFDCAGIKGKTPCNVPTCQAGFCKLKNRDAGTPCKDPSMVVGTCQEALCNEAGTCVAEAKKQGTVCDPGTPLGNCEQAACDTGATCKVGPKADGSHCGLGICGTKCVEGACVAATDADYDDGNPCTKDYCDQGAKVMHDPITDLTLACDDGDACTKSDFCLEGACSGKLDSCNDGLPCTVDTCDKTKGCQHLGDDKACASDDACVILACQLAVGCTATGVNEGATCDDGDVCTKVDACDKTGTCVGSDNECSCEKDGDCDQTNLCLPRLCDASTSKCVIDAAKAIVCDTSSDGFCAKTTCDAKTGKCATAALQEGKPCDDNDVCTGTSTCKAGLCTGSADKACDDKNPCTLDSCDPVAGCVSSPGGDACNDDNPCTEGDSCSNGACTGTAKACDDGVPCTFDGCDSKTGSCTNKATDANCNDNNPCTTDTCDATGAKGCASKPNDGGTCDDGDICTQTGCKSGQCIVTAVNKEIEGCGCEKDSECNDNNPCTADSCKAGNCVFDQAAKEGGSCSPSNVCLNPGSGACKAGACTGGTPKDCSADASKCVDTACNPVTGTCDKATKADGSKCDADGSLCTVDDVCQAGACIAGNAVDCAGSGDACNVASCDAKTGTCKTTPATKGTLCDDGEYCTDNDACDGSGKCVAGAARDCSGVADTCNTGTCDAKAQQCVKTPKSAGAACDDGLFCNEGEACDGKGTCTGGKPKLCATTSSCLVPVCDDVKDACGSAPATKGTSCNDGDACSLTDTCDGAGACVGANPKACAGDACNDGTCDAKTGACGLKPKAKGAGCNDGNLCTQTDTCDGAGKCAGANPKTCAGDACNEGICSPESGNCGKKPKIDGTACEDGSDCTSSDKCAAGVCKPGTYNCACKVDADCNDNNTCTVDKCAPSGTAVTCTNTVTAGAACNDGDACTTADTCSSTGGCLGKAVVCDDGNPCTADACSLKTGSCATTPQAKGFPCSDGLACTTGDACDGAGTCATTPVNCDDGNPCTTDACVPKTGSCSHVNNTSPCEDGNLCTLNDVCASGACVSGKAKSCADTTICTADACNPKTGACTNVATLEGSTCEQGSYSACNSGACGCRVGIKQIGGAVTNRLYDVVPTLDQGTLAVGETTGKGLDGQMTRRDKVGNIVWAKTLAFSSADNNADALQAVAAMSTSSTYLGVGYRYTGTANNNDGWAVHVDDKGNVLKNFLITGGAKPDMLRDVVAVNATTAYAVGYSQSFNNQAPAYYCGWLVKLNLAKSGYVEWQKAKIGVKVISSFPSISFKYDHYLFMGLAVSSTGKIFAAGYTTDGAFGGNDGVITAFDANGSQVGQNTFGTSGSDVLNAIQIYGTSTIWAAGGVSNGSNSTDGWIVRADQTTLGALGDKRFGSTSYDEFRDLTPYGSAVIAVGRKYDTAAGRYRPWMLRTTSVGNMSAEYVFDSTAQNRYLWAAAYNPSTGYVSAVGETYTGAIWDGYQVMTMAAGITACGNQTVPTK